MTMYAVLSKSILSFINVLMLNKNTLYRKSIEIMESLDFRDLYTEKKLSPKIIVKYNTILYFKNIYVFFSLFKLVNNY